MGTRQGLLFLGVAALGSVTYHLGQRTISTRANPMVLLMAVYALALVLSTAGGAAWRPCAAPGTGSSGTWPGR